MSMILISFLFYFILFIQVLLSYKVIVLRVCLKKIDEMVSSQYP